ncbi:hypothetical protein BKA81DRAFT_27510 [Phyllosticta paracitricarpa]
MVSLTSKQIGRNRGKKSVSSDRDQEPTSLLQTANIEYLPSRYSPESNPEPLRVGIRPPIAHQSVRMQSVSATEQVCAIIFGRLSYLILLSESGFYALPAVHGPEGKSKP